MARSEAPRERIGEMLVSLGLITRAQLEEALRAQRSTRMPVGKQLVALGWVSETRLTQVLSNQLSVPWVSLERIEFPAELLARIPAEIADRCSVMPIYVRQVRGSATLYVAMDDPTDEAALREVAMAAGIPVRPMIAPPSELRRVIDHRYFGAAVPPATPLSGEGTGLRSLPGRPIKQPIMPVGDRGIHKSKAPAPPPARKPPPPPGPPPAAPQIAKPDGVVAIEQYETPSQPPEKGGRMLTLLDGTQITLPTARSGRDTTEVHAVRHVIKAIREQGAEDTLRWHDIVQALIDASEARGVRLTRAEIGAAWLKQRAKRGETKAT